MRKSGSHVNARKGKGAICAVVAVLVAFVAALGITTTAQAALSDHTVPGVSPRGTTINVFDYWIQSRDYNDQNNGENYQNRGINANHVLKFGAGMGTQADETVINTNAVNYWTSSSAPRQGIVANRLGEDGYPVLSGTGSIGTSSLDYLFDSTSFDGKAAYMDVDGLLQVDDEGYYYYNSQANFAQFNDDGNGSGDFTLFNTWGVRAAGSSPDGQFFPFNNAAGGGQGDGAILTERRGGITQTDITSTDAAINHYFGLNMSTRFVQQDGGYTAPQDQGGKPVTYEFSGDDDVWIYIDGVLVGDLGGIHDASSISINFATGSVVINEGKTKQVAANRWDPDAYLSGGNWVRDVSIEQRTTLGAIMRAAGVTTGLDGNTFANDTYHTLDFFYLERGNTDSNMSLKYNLVNIPESGVVKVDQYGDALRGVQFTLREANANYSLVNGGMTVSGTTNNNGEFIFTHEVNGQDMPITLEQLNLESLYWVLTEDNVPEGYRSGGEMHLRFEDGFLLSSNEWDTGAWAEPHVTAVAPTQVVGTNGQTYDPANGIVFAVVFQFDENHNLHPVSGDDEKGWNVAEGTGKSDIIAAAKTNNYQFLLGSGGGYETTIENLPGDILTYEYVVSSNPGSTTEAKYAVRYYYAQGADSVYSLNDSSDIIELDPNASGNDFDRIFSVTLNVPNIKNELTLVKTDATSTTKLEGAEFALYNAVDFVDVDNHGQAIGTFTTDKNGSFNVTTSGDLLVKGEYVLVETEAPSGYELEQTPISIVVDDEGVHVDAGTASDNVSVETGIGDLVYSMRSFAAGDDVDSTLHDVKAQAQTADFYNGTSTKWDNTSAAVTHYQYDDTTDGLGYVRNENVPDNGDATFIAEADWSRLDLRQCMEHQGEDPIENKENLGDQSLNALFTGDVTIHVTNDRVGSLKISKTVENAPSNATDAKFTFELVVEKDGAAVTGEFDATFTDATGNTTQDKITLVDPADGAGNEITLMDGESVLIAGLPYGATYEVTEKPVDNYVSTSTGSTGTISNNTAAEAAFTNTYMTPLTIDAEEALSVVKNLENHSLADGQFHFVIEAVNTQGGATAAEAAAKLGLPEGTTTIEFSNDAATMANGVATDTMNPLQKDLTFTAADRGKTFTYEVSEVVPEDVPAGYVYDDNKYEVTYTVSSDVTSNLSVEASVDGNEVASGVPTVTFTNSYEPGVTTDSDAGTAIDVQKTVTGKATDVDFAFELKLTSGDATAVFEGSGDSKTAFDGMELTIGDDFKAGDSKTASFGDITFTAEGTYVFSVKEATPTPSPANGWTYDNATARTVTVTVDANQDGELSIAGVDYGNDSAPATADKNVTDAAAFTNSYKPSEVTTDSDADTAINVQKTVTGRETTADFAFELTLTSGDATAVFEGSGDSKDAFDGMELTIGDDFKAGDSKTASFGDITFTAEGSYVFSVKETTPAPSPANGWTYDNATARAVTVTVEDQNGQLVITGVTYDNADAPAPSDKGVTDAAAFTNSYTTSGTTTVTADDFVGLTKVLSGKAWGENDKFTFKIDRVTEGAPLPNVTEVTVGRADVDGQNEDGNDFANFGFGPIEFNAIGKYEYTVTEVKSSNPAIPVDTHTATVTITVSDNGTGGLTSSVVVTAQNGTFTNIYNPEGVTYAGVEIEKQLDGRDIVAGEFSFNVKPADTASAELAGIALEGEDIPLSTGATMNSDGVATSSLVLLGNKTLSTKDAGTYKYTISEVEGTDGAIAYDGTTYNVEIVVEDDGNGLIKVTTYVGCSDGSGWSATATNNKTDPAPSTLVELLFKNTYTSTGELPGEGEGRIVATKTFNNGSLDEKTFTFTVSATNAADVTKTYATGKATASGSIVFDPISYTKDGLIEDAKNGFASYAEVDGKDTYAYTYQVSENTDGLDDAGITPEVASLVAYVTVTDEGNGTLSTNVSYQQGMPNGLEFVNTYGKGAEASVYVAGTKSYDTAGTTDAPNIEGMFTFTLTGVVEGEPTVSAPLPGGATDKVEVTNSKGSVVFGTIDYDIEDAGKTYVYTVTESGSVPAVDNDVNSTRTFKVAVEDMNDGTITAMCSEKPGAQFSFTNSYRLDEPVDSSVSDQLTITKTLTGRDMADGEFEFVLLDENNQEVARGKSAAAADGEAAQVTFDPIEFDEIGAYDYTLREVDGDKGGVTYDGNSYVVRATVSDKGDGTMGVEWTFVGEGVTAADFENTYEASMTTVSNIGAVKTLAGRDLKAGEFEFALTRADGSVAATAKNAADGSVEFGTLTYKAEGVYEYTISEVSGSVEGVTYDTHECGVTVTVTDDGDGHLVASVAYDTADGGMPTFANTYVPTEDPVDPVDPGTPGGDDGDGDELVPDAGDHSGQGIGLVAVLGAAAVACGVVVCKVTKRQ